MSVFMMLQTEHSNLRRVLDILERQLALIEDGEHYQHDLCVAAVTYWGEYPEQCHHPKEDLLLRHLIGHGLRGAEQVHAHMLAEHDELQGLTGALLEAFGASSGGVADSGLENLLKQFIEHNRRHMAQEEELLFKVAPKILSEDDLETIEFDLLDRPDPVFDAAAEARFNILLNAIVGMNEDMQKASHDRHVRDRIFYGDTAWLGALTSVEKFNDLVGTGAFGRHVRLVPTQGGGYAVECDGAAVAAIPDCTEQQAAWCAYYYLVGAERG